MDRTVRFYANTVKYLLGILGGAALIACAAWLIQVSGPHAKPGGLAFLWGGIALFGFAVLVVIIAFIRDVVLRVPVFQVNDQGWSRQGKLFGKKKTANWQDIVHVGVYRQRIRRGLVGSLVAQNIYYIVVHGDDPNGSARVSPYTALNHRLYPGLRGALLVVPLNNLFLRATPAKVERILERIRAVYASEIRQYGIQIDTAIQRL